MLTVSYKNGMAKGENNAIYTLNNIWKLVKKKKIKKERKKETVR